MILIIDNCQKHADSLKQLLETHYFRVETALSGREALKKILQNHYKLILLNLQMSDIDGFEIAETINGLKKIEDVPLLFFSAEPLSVDFPLYKNVWDYMIKPFDLNLFVHKIKHAVQQHDKITVLKTSQRFLLEALEKNHPKEHFIKKNSQDDGALRYRRYFQHPSNKQI